MRGIAIRSELIVEWKKREVADSRKYACGPCTQGVHPGVVMSRVLF